MFAAGDGGDPLVARGRIMRTAILAAALVGLPVYSPAVIGQGDPGMRTDSIREIYVQPVEAKHRPLYEAMKTRQVLEFIRSLLSPFRLPRKLNLELKSCNGAVDAYYENDTATLCYEYIQLIQQHAPKVGTPAGLTRDDAIFGAVIDTLLHEAGHAVFDMLKIPILGREEDAADFFSAYFLLQFPSEDARRLIQGAAFMSASEAKATLEAPPELKALANEHALPAQRHYNLVCMAYGSDPNTFSNVVLRGQLPKERASGCADEYATLQHGFKTLILPYVDADMLHDVLARVAFNWSPAIPSSKALDQPPLGGAEP